jgi:hypothetical protein
MAAVSHEHPASRSERLFTCHVAFAPPVLPVSQGGPMFSRIRRFVTLDLPYWWHILINGQFAEARHGV